VPVVAQYEDAQAGKVIIDISNTLDADAAGLVTLTALPAGTRSPKGPRRAGTS
jgi:predicted dinucleotide-binding enzyme